MSANKYKKHVMVYTEDEATKQLAESFLNDDAFDLRRVTLQKCRGWKDAVDCAKRDGQLDKGERRAVVLIDLDKASTRVADIKGSIPSALQERIFVIGWTGEIEKLKSNTHCQGTGFRKLGETLASDCLNGCSGLWLDTAFNQIRPDLPQMCKTILPLITAP
jgi:hypothetical protein